HPREGLFRAQTPQVFDMVRRPPGSRALPADAADDVAVARAAGIDVWITQGSEDNLKLTYP
ncbi:MAG: 2-C-methyl-D-erythritol 4-phosphate cytidylyltransferase, partial [Rhodobacteraceae bacterium]|nr:2-C-methyl-D-erythritol 4-phosphate cytidylyltransferase [Paracoccaceae bacterium]